MRLALLQCQVGLLSTTLANLFTRKNFNLFHYWRNFVLLLEVIRLLGNFWFIFWETILFTDLSTTLVAITGLYWTGLLKGFQDEHLWNSNTKFWVFLFLFCSNIGFLWINHLIKTSSLPKSYWQILCFFLIINLDRGISYEWYYHILFHWTKHLSYPLIIPFNL